MYLNRLALIIVLLLLSLVLKAQLDKKLIYVKDITKEQFCQLGDSLSSLNRNELINKSWTEKYFKDSEGFCRAMKAWDYPIKIADKLQKKEQMQS